MSKYFIMCCMIQYIAANFISTDNPLSLCKESCNIVDMVNDRCQSQFTSMKGNRSAFLGDYVYNFNCSSPESYLIPDLPPDTEKCLQADDLCEFIHCSYILCPFLC